MLKNRSKSRFRQENVSLSVLETRLKRAVRPKDRLWATLRLAEELAGRESTQTERALLLFTEAEHLAESIGDRRGVAAALRGAGNCHLWLSNYVVALELLERALPIAEQTSDAECEITILRDMGIVYVRQSRQDLALTTLTKCAELAELIGNIHIQASALDHIGITLTNLDCYQEAIEHHTKSLALIEYTGRAHDLTIVLMNMSNALRFLGRYGEALSTMERASALSRAERNDLDEAMCRGRIGIIYTDIGDYQNALSFLLASTTILERIGNKLDLGKAYVNLMSFYLQTGAEQTVEFGKKALILFKEIGDKRGQAAIYGNLGQYYLSRGDTIRAKRLLKRCLTLSREIGSKHNETMILTGLAAMESDSGQFVTAERLYQNALAIASTGGDRDGTITALLGLGDLSNKRGGSDPLPFLERAVTIAGEIHSRRHEQEAHQLLSEALEAKGDLALALKHLKLASGIKEEILGTEKQKAIAEIQIRYNIERLEQETELLRKETKLLKEGRDHKSQEIERMTIELSERTEVLRTIRRRIWKILKSKGSGIVGDARTQINQLLSELAHDHSAGRKRTIFNNEFQQVHREFLRKLSQHYPALTITQRKICVLLAEGFSIKEMTAMLKVSTKTIEEHRYQIRKKMKLERGMSLSTKLTTL